MENYQLINYVQNREIDRLTTYLLLYPIFIVFFTPNVIEYIGIYRYIALASTAISVVSLVLLVRWLKDKFMTGVLILLTVFLIATFFNTGSISIYWYNFRLSIGFLCIAYEFHNYSEKTFWTAFSDYTALITYLNLIFLLINSKGILQIITPNGLVKGIHFLGQANQNAPYLLVALILSQVVKNKYNRRVLRSKLLPVTVVVTLLLLKSTTAFLGILLYFLLYIFFRIFYVFKHTDFRYKNRILNHIKKKRLIYLFCLFVGLLHISIVVFDIQQNFSLIFNLTGKSITFSSRTQIWDIALNKIRSAPVLGYGLIQERYIATTSRIFDSHNLFLEITLMGGCLALLFFVFITIVSLKKMLMITNRNVRYSIYSAYISIFIMSITEYYGFYKIIWFLMIPVLLSKNEPKITLTKPIFYRELS